MKGAEVLEQLKTLLQRDEHSAIPKLIYKLACGVEEHLINDVSISLIEEGISATLTDREINYDPFSVWGKSYNEPPSLRKTSAHTQFSRAFYA